MGFALTKPKTVPLLYADPLLKADGSPGMHFTKRAATFDFRCHMTARTFHVAILDDDPSVRIALIRLLKAMEIPAQAYATSGQLFESIAVKHPDCLLLDLEMPEVTGLDVLKYLDARHIRIPTIIITGHQDADLRSACLKAGALACLSKPFNADHLIRMIENILVPSQPDKVPAFT